MEERRPGDPFLSDDRTAVRVLEAQMGKYGVGSKEGVRAWAKLDRLVEQMPELEAERRSIGEVLTGEFWLRREKVEEQIRENFPDVLAPIPTYDPMRPCPKCGKKKAATSWITDRLHRTCKRCGFGWVERPLGPENAEEAPDLPGEG
jgi:hypothetical protein